MSPRNGSRQFVVTSQGVSASRWLAFVLASHPKAFVAHGHFPIDSVVGGEFQREKSNGDAESLSIGSATRTLYEAKTIDEIFAVYRSLRPEADAYGSVHSYTLDDLMRQRSGNSGDPKFAIANLVRHPVSYIESHSALVRKAEQYPAVYRGYASGQFPRALGEFQELFLVSCPDLRDFLAFATSCYSALNVVRDLTHEQVRHHRMETLTTDTAALEEFCRSLTGLHYPEEGLGTFVAQGAINRHRKGGADGGDPSSIYRSWPVWKQDIAAVMISDAALARFEGVGYDVAMLRDGAGEAGRASATVPCLADSLKAMDRDHPLLDALDNGAVNGRARTLNPPILVEIGHLGHNIVSFRGRYYALAQSAGHVDLAELDHAALEQFASDVSLFGIKKKLALAAASRPRSKSWRRYF